MASRLMGFYHNLMELITMIKEGMSVRVGDGDRRVQSPF